LSGTPAVPVKAQHRQETGVVAGRIEQRAVLPALQRRRHWEICKLV